MFADPFLTPDLFDTVVCAGIASPGVAKITSGKRVQVIEKKQGPGAAGANITFRGKDVLEFQIDVTMWTEDQLEAFDAWVDLWDFDPTKTKTIQPVDILHPILDQVGVYQAVAKEIGQLEHQGGGRWTCKLSCVEWRPPPPKNVTSSPKGTKSSTDPTPGGGKPPPTAEDILKDLEMSANTRANDPK